MGDIQKKRTSTFHTAFNKIIITRNNECGLTMTIFSIFFLLYKLFVQLTYRENKNYKIPHKILLFISFIHLFYNPKETWRVDKKKKETLKKKYNSLEIFSLDLCKISIIFSYK